MRENAREEWTEEDLLAAVADGDRGAFDELYRRHVFLLMARLRHRVADTQLLEDVVQEAFLALWRQSAEPDRPVVRDVPGWLWRTASRRLVDQVRSGGARQRLQQTLRRLFARDTEASAEDRALESVEYGDLHQALGRLPPPLRDVIQATVLDGLTTEEAAVRLAVPPGTVKTRASRARRQLRTHLGRERWNEA